MPRKRKKGGGRETSPFFILDDGSVPSTGQRPEHGGHARSRSEPGS